MTDTDTDIDTDTDDPHGDQSVEHAGTALEDATAVMVLVHGRGARAEGMLDLGRQVSEDVTNVANVALLAPAATRNTWYPHPFTAPTDANEPFLSSALSKLTATIERAAQHGISRKKVILVGFSQGACLSLEYAARNAERYGGVVAFSGGVIGEQVDRERYGDSMDHTPVFLGCSDRDPHITLERVEESTAVFEALEADVTERIYDGMGHTINEDELEYLGELVASVASGE